MGVRGNSKLNIQKIVAKPLQILHNRKKHLGGRPHEKAKN